MLEAVMRDLRTGAGTGSEVVADLGVVHTGRVGLQQCAVSVRIEHASGLFHLCVETELSDGPGFRRTRVVRWPYSRRDRRDLARVLVDLHVVRAGPRRHVFVDDRGPAARLLDGLTRRVVHGTYRFRSPVAGDPQRPVEAELVDVGAARTVTLAESTARGGRIAAHLPHAAFAGICAAVERYVAIV